MLATALSHWNETDYQTGSLLTGLIDLNGIWRGKRLPASDLDKAMKGQMRMPLSICAADIWGEDTVGGKLVFESGDQDGPCHATDRGPIPMPWMKTPTQLLQVSLNNDDGSPFEADARCCLQTILSKYQAMRLTPIIGIELEFYLFDNSAAKPKPIGINDSNQVAIADQILSLDILEKLEPFFADVNMSCKMASIALDSTISEAGPLQFEYTLKHSNNALSVADDAILFKKII